MLNMTYIMRDINKCCAGIYRKRNIRTHFTNMAYVVNRNQRVADI